MMFFDKVRSTSPIIKIEWVISVFTLVGGFYLFTPLYDTSVRQVGASVIGAALASSGMILFWGALLLIGALLVIVGLLKDKPQLKSIGLFTIILARTFQLLTTFLVGAFFPITWMYPLTILMVVIILWGLEREEVRRRGS